MEKAKAAKKPVAEHKGRPKHPPCPECGKAMYKQMGAQPVTKDDPWAYCRNKSCKLYAKDQSKGAPRPKLSLAPPPQEDAAPVVKSSPFKEINEALKKRDLAKSDAKVANEPEEIKRARARIKEALAANGTYTKAVVGLTLTLVAQEMNSHEIADRLIEEFDLTTLYGIEKQSPVAG